MKAPLIIGAGPAGIRAAASLAAAGLRPVVVDENPACGGQIYRQPLAPDGRSARARYGSEAAKAERLHREFADLSGRIDYRPGTLVWNIAPGVAHLVRNSESSDLSFDGLILASGAMDRVLPAPGWTLPGVFTLGGAQIALKAQGVAIGRRVIFVGSGPLLYLVAWQYVRAGIEVAAVLDCAPFSAKFAVLKAFLLGPRTILPGIGYVLGLLRHGVPIRFGVTGLRFLGSYKLSGVEWQEGSKTRTLECDGAGFGLGLKPEGQLADLAGCAFTYSKRDRAEIPFRDRACRSSIPRIYLAGDGSGILGADAAELAGERAALALIEDRGLAFDARRAARLERLLLWQDRFRDVIDVAFPHPRSWPLSDETVVCRCEEITVGEARATISQYGITEVNRLKALSRIGMGRCQGRVCGASAAELLAATAGLPLTKVGRLRGQAPVKPLPLNLHSPVPEQAP